MFHVSNAGGKIFYHVTFIGSMFDSTALALRDGQTYNRVYERPGNVLYCMGTMFGSTDLPCELPYDTHVVCVTWQFDDEANKFRIDLQAGEVHMLREFDLPAEIRAPMLSDRRMAFVFHYDHSEYSMSTGDRLLPCLKIHAEPSYVELLR